MNDNDFAEKQDVVNEDKKQTVMPSVVTIAIFVFLFFILMIGYDILVREEPAILFVFSRLIGFLYIGILAVLILYLRMRFIAAYYASVALIAFGFVSLMMSIIGYAREGMMLDAILFFIILVIPAAVLLYFYTRKNVRDYFRGSRQLGVSEENEQANH